MKKKIRYIEEIYTDEYRTLYQAIQIDVDYDKKSNGLNSKSIRAMINPSLTNSNRTLGIICPLFSIVLESPCCSP